MKVVQINHFSYKAAGGIMMNIHRALLNIGVDSFVVWGRGRQAENDKEYYMNDSLGVKCHALYTRLTDKTGFVSKKSTSQLLNWLDEAKPDIIHLHCVHGYYINIELLFKYIKENHIKLVWTQHDCWSFTGHCAYFDSVGCDKWKNGCFACPQLGTYPKTRVDNSKENWLKKKQLFTGLDAVCVAPCEWLKGLLGESFLSEYPCRVIYNGVDTKIFHYVESNFREKHGLQNYSLILGVASEWTERKGLKDFVSLDTMLDHNKYKILLIGLTKEQVKDVPNSIFAMERTSNVQELVEIYSSADVYFNPTYEDNFPTTNIEAIACGLKVITYRTGGSPEAVNHGAGYVVEKGDLEGVCELLSKLNDTSYNERVQKEFNKTWQFSSEKMTNEYLLLYKELNAGGQSENKKSGF